MQLANDNTDPVEKTFWDVHMGLNELINMNSDQLKKYAQDVLETLVQVKTLVSKATGTEADDALVGLGLSVEAACNTPASLFDGVRVDHGDSTIDPAEAFQIMADALAAKAVSLQNARSI